MTAPARNLVWLIGVFVVVGGAALYLSTRSMDTDTTDQLPVSQADSTELSEQATATPSPTPSSEPVNLNAEAAAIEKTLDSVSESDFDDSSLSDSALGL